MRFRLARAARRSVGERCSGVETRGRSGKRAANLMTHSGTSTRARGASEIRVSECQSFREERARLPQVAQVVDAGGVARVQVARAFSKHDFHLNTISTFLAFPLKHHFHLNTISTFLSFPLKHDFHLNTISRRRHLSRRWRNVGPGAVILTGRVGVRVVPDAAHGVGRRVMQDRLRPKTFAAHSFGRLVRM